MFPAPRDGEPLPEPGSNAADGTSTVLRDVADRIRAARRHVDSKNESRAAAARNEVSRLISYAMGLLEGQGAAAPGSFLRLLDSVESEEEKDDLDAFADKLDELSGGATRHPVLVGLGVAYLIEKGVEVYKEYNAHNQ